MKNRIAIDWEELIQEAPSLTASTIKELEQEWPYFVWPALTALDLNLMEDEKEAQHQRSRIAMATGDREALARVLQPDSDFADFYPDMKPVKLTTDATIDAFLNHYGAASDKETDMLTSMIFDSSARASAQPLAEVETDSPQPPLSRSASAIESFLSSHPTPHAEELPFPKKESTPPVTSTTAQESAPAGRQEENTPVLTLSLVKMMIKNSNYTKALEILQKLNLDNPEKNTIFADQIRFLQKLILIQKHSNSL